MTIKIMDIYFIHLRGMMMKTKTEFKLFIGLDWDKEKNYLSNQHKNGWSFIFKNVCGFYYFAEC